MVQMTNAVERYNKIILNELKEANIYCWIAGGALRDYFAGVKVNTDYDLFFPNEKEYNKCKEYFKSKDCKINIINESNDDQQDLMKDLVSVITSFCCRLYGMRRGAKKSREIKNNIL